MQRRRIVMLGTSFETMGGVSAVVDLYRASGFLRAWDIRYIPTHRDGSALTKARVFARALGTFLSLLVLGRVALAHVHSSSGISFWRKSCLILLAFLFRVPVVFHLHGGDFEGFVGRQIPAVRALIRLVLSRSTRVVALSEEWRRRIVPLCGHDRVVVIPNPVAIPARGPLTLRRRRTLLFLGRINESKGAYDLLAALSLLRFEFPDLQLLMGGDGDHDAFLDAARGLSLTQQVRLLGWVTGARKHQLLSCCTMFVLPSHAECLPVAMLEAMAAGAPVIATRVGGIPDALQDGTEGLLVEPRTVGDLAGAIRTLLLNDSLRHRLGAAAKARVVASNDVQLIRAMLGTLYQQLGLEPAHAEPVGTLARAEG